jgi:hypothetical protein
MVLVAPWLALLAWLVVVLSRAGGTVRRGGGAG